MLQYISSILKWLVTVGGSIWALDQEDDEDALLLDPKEQAPGRFLAYTGHPSVSLLTWRLGSAQSSFNPVSAGISGGPADDQEQTGPFQLY